IASKSASLPSLKIGAKVKSGEDSKTTDPARGPGRNDWTESHVMRRAPERKTLPGRLQTNAKIECRKRTTGRRCNSRTVLRSFARFTHPHPLLPLRQAGEGRRTADSAIRHTPEPPARAPARPIR